MAARCSAAPSPEDCRFVPLPPPLPFWAPAAKAPMSGLSPVRAARPAEQHRPSKALAEQG